MFTVGDRVKILEGNDYDKAVLGYGEAGYLEQFAGLTGVVIQVVHPELTFPELSDDPIYRVEVEGNSLILLESNPWPFYENELGLL